MKMVSFGALSILLTSNVCLQWPFSLSAMAIQSSKPILKKMKTTRGGTFYNRLKRGDVFFSMHKTSFDLFSKLFAEPLFLESMSKSDQISFLKSVYFGIEQVDNLLVLAEWMRHAAQIEELRMETADVFIRYFNSESKVVLLNKQTVVALLHLNPQKYLKDLDPL